MTILELIYKRDLLFKAVLYAELISEKIERQRALDIVNSIFTKAKTDWEEDLSPYIMGKLQRDIKR